MNFEAVLSLIDRIHPDDYPDEALLLFRLLCVAVDLPKGSLIRLLKRQLGEELVRSTNATKSEIMEALGLAPILVEKRKPKPSLDSLCSFAGCLAPARATSLCPGHYRQAKRGQALRPLRPRRMNAAPIQNE